MFAMLYVAFLTVYEHYMLDETTIGHIMATRASHPELIHAKPPSSMSNSSQLQQDSMKLSFWGANLRWFRSLTVVPVLCFAYQTHEVIVPAYACMKRRVFGDFVKASLLGLTILFLLYNLVGAYGYLTFGSRVGPDIMSLYDAKDPVVIVGIVALVIKFITTYPPLMFCGRGALDGLYGELRKLSTDELKSSERSRRLVITTLWFFSTVALAVFAPDISLTLQLLGSMASINVFVFPGMCLISLTWRLQRARRLRIYESLEQQAWLAGGTNQNGARSAKDYYLISGSYFGEAMKKRQSLGQRASKTTTTTATANGNINSPDEINHKNSNGNNQGAGGRQFTATFASLIEFENNTISGEFKSNGGSVGRKQTTNNLEGSGSSNASSSSSRIQRRQEEFERLITTNGAPRCQINVCEVSSKPNRHNGPHNHHHESYVAGYESFGYEMLSPGNSWLERFGNSLAPTRVAQVGVGPLMGALLYIFAILLIVFGVFIFFLELVDVIGLL